MSGALADDDPTLTVTSNPLWTDTGILLQSRDRVLIHDAVGSWRWGDVPFFGPDGDYQPTRTFDEWITDAQNGELIGFTTDSTIDPNSFPRLISQDAPGLFHIASGAYLVHGVTGHLWLGFNDDYATNDISDNAGTVDVILDRCPDDPIPAPRILSPANGDAIAPRMTITAQQRNNCLLPSEIRPALFEYSTDQEHWTEIWRGTDSFSDQESPTLHQLWEGRWDTTGLPGGTYFIRVTMESSSGQSASDSVCVRVDEPPLAVIAVAPGPTTGEVSFCGNASSDDGMVVSWSWDFGDGDTACGSTVDHIFSDLDQTYTVSLTVTDDDGNTDTEYVDIFFVDGVPQAAPANNCICTSVAVRTGGQAPLCQYE